MKKSMYVLSMLCFAVAVSFAQSSTQTSKTEKVVKQERATPEQRAQSAVAEIDKVVTLTADQKSKIQKLALDKISKLDAIRAKYKDQKDAGKEEMEQVRKMYRQDVKAVLTPEQIEKAKAREKAVKEKKSGAKKDILGGNE
ncbi:MAG: hypothetical protein IPN22_11620 [Bacteroidetes bacterium]|nr:hypothetical protein [Bacteroidota bacterium]